MPGKALAKKTCFIACPIGDAGTTSRIHADWLFKGIIKPVFERHFPDFSLVRSDLLQRAGMIDSQIIEPLLNAELVIVDMTESNPNVFYEMGIRHMANKPVVHICLKGTRIPFDVSPFRAIMFSRDEFDQIDLAKVELQQFVNEALSPEHRVDTPVSTALGKIKFNVEATPAERLLADEMAEIKARLADLEIARGLGASTPSQRGATGGLGATIQQLCRLQLFIRQSTSQLRLEQILVQTAGHIESIGLRVHSRGYATEDRKLVEIEFGPLTEMVRNFLQGYLLGMPEVSGLAFDEVTPKS